MNVKNLSFFAIFVFVLVVVPVEPIQADVINIPEINSRVPEEFVLESIATLDDFIEEMRHLRATRSKETAGFVISGIAQVGALTGVMADRLLFKSKLLNDAVSDFKSIHVVGRAGSSVTSRAGSLTRRWLVTSGAVQNMTNDKSKGEFTVHPEDFPIFIDILSEVRDAQNMILYRFLREKAKTDLQAKHKLENQAMIIMENRPSYKNIYDSCAGDPSGYKNATYISMYHDSLFEYFKLLMLDANHITTQIQAKFIAPTLSHYLNREALPFALRKCFNVSKNANGIFEDESNRFVAQLLAVDMAAKFVVVATIYSVWKFKDFLASRAGTSTGPSLLDKIINKMPATIQKAVNYAKGAFAKISPQMIAKAVVITQVASSSYALWAIKNDYDAINAHNGDRREVAEFRKLAYGKLTSLADQHVKALTDALAQKDIGSQDREKLEAEIKKWQTMKAQYQS